MTDVLDQLEEVRQTKRKETQHDILSYREFLGLLARGSTLAANQLAGLVKLLNRLGLTTDIMAGDIDIMKTCLAEEAFVAGFDQEQTRIHEEQLVASADAKRLHEEMRAAQIRVQVLSRAASLNVFRKTEIHKFQQANPRVCSSDPLVAAGCHAPAKTMQQVSQAAALERRF